MELLCTSSIFIFTSRAEGNSIALSKAMSVGLPCIICANTIRIDNIIVEGYNGLVAEVEDDLPRILSNLINDIELRKKLGANAKNHVAEFSESIILAKYEKVFEEISSK